jgi:hypothetical protein
MQLQKIRYKNLNARQKESFNYQKISGVLAEYGFATIRLSDDWKGADFLAQHIDGRTLRVQLKGRMSFSKKYQGKDLWVCFRDGMDWYLYPHDGFLNRVLAETTIRKTRSWQRGPYHFPSLSKQLQKLLLPYRIAHEKIVR